MAELWGSGFNNQGQLGQGDTSNRNTLTQIGSATNWIKAEGELNHGYFLNSVGELWAVGGNTSGQLGQGNTTSPVTSLVQIGTDTDWDDISCGNTHGYFLKSGQLWGVGGNTNGQLGQGNTTSPVTTVVRIGMASNWTKIAAGLNHGYFLNSSGELWAVGLNTDGQLGQGNTTSPVTSLVQIGAATNWTDIAAGVRSGYFLNASGELWGVGDNDNGQLGQGNTTTPQTSLVQIGVATDWDKIAGGGDHACFINTSGELWAVGLNTSGQLGQGNTTSPITSLTQVGVATDWDKIDCGINHTLAGNTSSETWGTGLNTSGQLAQGNFTSPVTSLTQIGAGSTWLKATGGGLTSYFLEIMEVGMAAVQSEYQRIDPTYNLTTQKVHQNLMGLTSNGVIKGYFFHEESAVDVASLVDGAGATVSITIPSLGDNGVQLGDAVVGISFAVDLQDITVTGYVQAANTVEIRVQNESGSTVDLASTTVRLIIADLT